MYSKLVLIIFCRRVKLCPKMYLEITLNTYKLNFFFPGGKPYDGMTAKEACFFVRSGHRMPRPSAISLELWVRQFVKFILFVQYVQFRSCLLTQQLNTRLTIMHKAIWYLLNFALGGLSDVAIVIMQLWNIRLQRFLQLLSSIQLGIVLIVSNFCLWTQPFYNFLSFFSYELMLQCWNKEPSQRPKFSDIVIWMEKSLQRV